MGQTMFWYVRTEKKGGEPWDRTGALTRLGAQLLLQAMRDSAASHNACKCKHHLELSPLSRC